jgi:hypothetical protein
MHIQIPGYIRATSGHALGGNSDSAFYYHAERGNETHPVARMSCGKRYTMHIQIPGYIRATSCHALRGNSDAAFYYHAERGNETHKSIS